MMSDVEILGALETGAIVIKPFREKHLNNMSYDLTLGQYIFRLKKPRPEGLLLDGDLIFNPIPEDISHAECTILQPFERILGHTEEFVGGTVVGSLAVNTHMQAVSTAERLGITCCLDAGYGDVGYVNRWALEILNLNPFPVALPYRSILCQMIFTRVTLPSKMYHEQGQYQDSWIVDEDSWKPESILPRRLKIAEPVFSEKEISKKYQMTEDPSITVEVLHYNEETDEVQYEYSKSGKIGFKSYERFLETFSPCE